MFFLVFSNYSVMPNGNGYSVVISGKWHSADRVHHICNDIVSVINIAFISKNGVTRGRSVQLGVPTRSTYVYVCTYTI